MFSILSQLKLRPWLIAAAAVLLLTSIIEAGHGHGVFVPADDSCAICQQVIGLDKTLISKPILLVLLLVTLLALALSVSASPLVATPFTHIRAPPAQLHIR